MVFRRILPFIYLLFISSRLTSVSHEGYVDKEFFHVCSKDNCCLLLVGLFFSGYWLVALWLIARWRVNLLA
jgi:hypothetical protein